MRIAATKLGITASMNNSRKQFLNKTGMFSNRNSIVQRQNIKDSESRSRIKPNGPISVRQNY